MSFLALVFVVLDNHTPNLNVFGIWKPFWVDGHKAKLELERQTTLTYAPRVRIIPQLNIKFEYIQQALEKIPSRRLPLFVSALNRFPPCSEISNALYFLRRVPSGN